MRMPLFESVIRCVIVAALVLGAAPLCAQKAVRHTIKPGAPLTVRVDVQGPLAPGVAATAEIVVSTSVDVSAVSLTLDGAGTLVVTAGDPAVPATGFRIDALAAGTTWAQPVRLLPLTPGRHTLNVVAVGEASSFGTVARTLVVPIEAGGPANAGAPTVGGVPAARAGDTGQAEAGKAAAGIRSLPAVERVR